MKVRSKIAFALVPIGVLTLGAGILTNNVLFFIVGGLIIVLAVLIGTKADERFSTLMDAIMNIITNG